MGDQSDKVELALRASLSSPQRETVGVDQAPAAANDGALIATLQFQMHPGFRFAAGGESTLTGMPVSTSVRDLEQPDSNDSIECEPVP